MLRKLLLLSLAAAAGCSTAESADPAANPFLQDQSDDGKEDSAYMNPDGIEVEVDLEGDVEGPAYRLQDGPIDVGQYAMTYFRKSETMFIESLAEDALALLASAPGLDLVAVLLPTLFGRLATVRVAPVEPLAHDRRQGSSGDADEGGVDRGARLHHAAPRRRTARPAAAAGGAGRTQRDS